MATVTGSGLVVKETEKRESRVRRNATTARDPSDHAFTRSSKYYYCSSNVTMLICILTYRCITVSNV